MFKVESNSQKTDSTLDQATTILGKRGYPTELVDNSPISWSYETAEPLDGETLRQLRRLEISIENV